jgi:hypothetical protein
MRICDYCKTAMYWDKESALRQGKKSQELPSSTRFRIGGTGKLKGSSFRVLGRLVYAHENGTWSEWFIEMDDGKIMWLTEDEGELFLEAPLELTTPPPAFNELAPGMQIALNDKIGIVEEIGQANCLGGEGQIPFRVEVGESYPYADGATGDGRSSFGLEYDRATGKVHAFLGKIVQSKEDRTRKEDRAAPIDRIGEIIRCPSCGKPYEGPRAKTTAMVVCDACGAGLTLDEAEIRVVGKNPERVPIFIFRIGLPVTIDGTSYEVMGRLLYEEKEEDIPYTSTDYVLYNPQAGYLWLSEYRGHYTVGRVIHDRVVIPRPAKAKTKVQVGPDAFQVYESGEVTLKWVDGAIPWTASVGERSKYTRLISPPEYVDEELTGKEKELVRGRYLCREELTAALPEDVALPDARGAFSCQPYVTSPWLQGLGSIAGVFALLNVLLLLYSIMGEKNTFVLQETLTAEQYAKEHMTGTFQVIRDNTILRLRGSTPLDNSWIAMDFAVVDQNDRVLSEFTSDASYYHGRDSDGSWNEGGPTFSSHFKINKAGTYRLLIHGQGGSGVGGPPRNEALRIMVTAGNTVKWYFVFPLAVCGLIALIGPLRRWSFEKRRWAEVAGGSTDDDD